MGALPKNKITRAERGKRRAGNTPSLKKDIHTTKAPLHKVALSAAMLADMGFAKDAPKREIKKRAGGSNELSRLNEEHVHAAQNVSGGMDKSKHRAQHKG